LPVRGLTWLQLLAEVFVNCFSSTYRIGVDLGGTKIETLLLAPEDTVLHRRRLPSPAADGYDSVLAALHTLITETADHVPAGSPYTVGIGIPGSLNPATGLVQNANSTCLIGHPLKNDLERLLSRPVGIRNDADCFALAESRRGAGQGYGLVFGVIMGTGCGGGLCIDGEVREGPHRIAGEWGHYSVDPEGALCYCGNRGCVETKISGSGVERAFGSRYGRLLTMEKIVAGARQGDGECREAFDRFLDDFGRCLGGLISILDPDAVVLGGGLSGIDELYTAGVERVRRYVFVRGDLRTPIIRNRLGDSAGVFGAAWIGV
jgi:fructokinase